MASLEYGMIGCSVISETWLDNSCSLFLFGRLDIRKGLTKFYAGHFVVLSFDDRL